MFPIRVLHLAVMIVFLLWPSSPSVYPHTSLANVVQHRISLKINPTNIDIEIQLTFYSLRSLPIRQFMDLDHNEMISPSEIQYYLQSQENTFSDSLTLGVDNREIALVSLYNPEIDLLGNNKVGPFPMVLHLFYFARTPEWLHADSLLTFADRLWSELPAIRSFESSGDQGIQTEVLPDSSVSPSDNSVPSGQRWMIRCMSSGMKNISAAYPPHNPLADPVVMQVMQKSNSIRNKFLLVSGIGVLIILGFGYDLLKRYFRQSEF